MLRTIGALFVAMFTLAFLALGGLGLLVGIVGGVIGLVIGLVTGVVGLVGAVIVSVAGAAFPLVAVVLIVAGLVALTTG